MAAGAAVIEVVAATEDDIADHPAGVGDQVPGENIRPLPPPK